MIYYPYTKFVTNIKALVRMTKEYNSDTIVAISRGGLTLGHAYASATNNRQLMSVNSILYQKNVRDKTMQEVLTRIYLSYPDLEVKIASIYYKTDAVVQADFALHEAT